MSSRKTASSLLEPFQKSSRRPDAIAAAPTADNFCQCFDLAQPVSLRLAPISGMTKRMVLRAIG